MRGRRIALFFFSVVLSACASLEPEKSEIPWAKSREALVGCTKVGIIPYGDSHTVGLPGSLEARLRAQVTSLGGNTLFGGDGRHPYVEIWSCADENTVTTR